MTKYLTHYARFSDNRVNLRALKLCQHLEAADSRSFKVWATLHITGAGFVKVRQGALPCCCLPTVLAKPTQIYMKTNTHTKNTHTNTHTKLATFLVTLVLLILKVTRG